MCELAKGMMHLDPRSARIRRIWSDSCYREIRRILNSTQLLKTGRPISLRKASHHLHRLRAYSTATKQLVRKRHGRKSSSSSSGLQLLRL